MAAGSAIATPMGDTSIIAVERIEFAVAPFDWPFAAARRGEIDAHFAMRRRTAPDMWNGRIMLMRDLAFAGGALRGASFETDYASFLAWRDWDFPDRSVVNCFSMGALRASDGAYLLGVMGAHTASPGWIYFPAGTPEPGDIRDGHVDFAGSMLREIAEETGLERVAAEAGWTVVRDRQFVALMKVIDMKERAEDLRRIILANIARQARPELADIRIVRSRRDFGPMMPRFVTAFMSHMLAE
jgi:hypothetical protein